MSWVVTSVANFRIMMKLLLTHNKRPEVNLTLSYIQTEAVVNHF